MLERMKIYFASLYYGTYVHSHGDSSLPESVSISGSVVKHNVVGMDLENSH